MDVAVALTDKLRLLAARAARRISLAILTGLLAGCSGPEPAPTLPVPSESFTELKEKVAALRGLTFKREVSLAKEPRETAEDESEVLFAEEYGAPTVAPIARAYKRIGLLPESVDFANALTDFFRLQRSAAYDARKEAIEFTPDAAALAKTLAAAPARATAQIPAVLALTQALQEQHFQWQEKLKVISLEDRKLALRAVAYGDALLSGLAYLDANQQTKWADQAQAIGRWATELEKMGAHLPELLRQKLVFPYREGSHFVQWAKAAKGRTGVNALFANPPLSASQILHPEKYFVRRQDGLRILPYGLIRSMKAGAIIDQTLGEGLIQALLAPRYSRKEAARLAAGWTGDHLSAYPDGDNVITAWISAWSSDKSALNFFRAYETILERRHRSRLAPSTGRKESLQAELAGRRSMVLEVRGSVVLFLDGLALARALGLAEEVWLDLEIETEPTAFPFDSARKAAHWSWRSR